MQATKVVFQPIEIVFISRWTLDRFNKFVKYQPLKSQMPHFDKIQQAFITCPNRYW